MLLAIDIGNSSIHCGVFYAAELRHEWHLATEREATVATLSAAFRDALQAVAAAPAMLQGVVVASVVPPLDAALAECMRQITGSAPLAVDHTNAGVPIIYPHPEEIGADRLANAAGAIAKYGAPCLVVDFGTATTFDYIDPTGDYCGGPIAPGVGIGNAALAQAAAKLQPTPLASTDRLIPQSTAEAIQAGVFHGYVGLTEHLIGRLQREVGTHPKVIATGGLAAIIAPACPSIQTINPHLTLDGLHTIWVRNS